jgi:uncharacterized protein YndB with AHSA1/START domain
MALLKKIIIGLVGLIALLVAVGFLLPSHFKVERSMEIAAPPEKIFSNIEDPHAWAKWTVWNQRDPNMQMTYSGAEKGQGAQWAWRSKTEGNGSMEFTNIDAPKLMEYRLSFPDYGMTSTGTMTLTPSGTGTKVSWTNEGDLGANPMNRYFGLIMDSMVGKDFDAGLKNLKALAEK